MKSWLDLEDRFRRLVAPLQGLRLDFQWGAAGEHWRICGSLNSASTRQFEALVEVADLMLMKCIGKESEIGSLIFIEQHPPYRWYRALKELSGGFQLETPAQQFDENGNFAGNIFAGRLDNVVDASANLCLKLHARYPYSANAAEEMHADRMDAGEGSPNPPNNKAWHAFISYASEDKPFVAQLAEALKVRGLDIWYDEDILEVGDSLRRSIECGLANSQWGIVIVSPAFFNKEKEWPKKELDAFFDKESKGSQVILPVWHNVTRDEVAKHSLLLAGKKALKTESGLDDIAQKLLRKIGHEKRGRGDVGTIIGLEIEKAEESLRERVVFNNILGEINYCSQDKGIKVEAGYFRVNITSDLHEYFLLFRVTLLEPPSITNPRIRLYWPKHVSIIGIHGFNEEHANSTNDHVCLVCNLKRTFYVGDPVYVAGPGPSNIKYKYDDYIWDKMESSAAPGRASQRSLVWKLFLLDRQPLEGEISFSHLNCY